jgi:hypothetical protein
MQQENPKWNENTSYIEKAEVTAARRRGSEGEGEGEGVTAR